LSGKEETLSNSSVESKQNNPNITDPIESLYIHVPFCTRKCGYCDFYSLSSKVADFSDFYYGLQAELAATLSDIAQNDLHL